MCGIGIVEMRRCRVPRLTNCLCDTDDQVVFLSCHEFPIYLQHDTFESRQTFSIYITDPIFTDIYYSMDVWPILRDLHSPIAGKMNCFQGVCKLQQTIANVQSHSSASVINQETIVSTTAGMLNRPTAQAAAMDIAHMARTEVNMYAKLMDTTTPDKMLITSSSQKKTPMENVFVNATDKNVMKDVTKPEMDMFTMLMDELPENKTIVLTTKPEKMLNTPSNQIETTTGIGVSKSALTSAIKKDIVNIKPEKMFTKPEKMLITLPNQIETTTDIGVIESVLTSTIKKDIVNIKSEKMLITLPTHVESTTNIADINPTPSIQIHPTIHHGKQITLNSSRELNGSACEIIVRNAVFTQNPPPQTPEGILVVIISVLTIFVFFLVIIVVAVSIKKKKSYSINLPTLLDGVGEIIEMKEMGVEMEEIV